MNGARRDSLYVLLWTVQIVCATLFTPLTTRLLDLGQFGTVTSTTAVMQVLFVVAGLGLQNAVQREHAADPRGPGAGQLILAALLLTAGIAFVAWSTAGLWAPALGLADETAVLRLACLWAGTSALTTVCLGLLRSRDRLLAFALVTALQSVVAEGFALGLVAVGEPTAETFLAGQVAAQVAALIAGLVAAPPALLRWRDRMRLEYALRFALPLVPPALGFFVLSVADRLVIEAHLGSEAVGRYQVAYSVAAVPMLLLSVLDAAWTTRRSDRAERRAALAAGRDALYRLMPPIVVGSACAAPLLLRAWAPPSYDTGSLRLVVGVVLIAAIPFAGQLAMTRTLMAEGRAAVTTIGTLLAAVANVLLNLVLVPRWGLTGAAIATLTAYALLVVVLAAAGRESLVRPAPPVLQARLVAAAGLALLAVTVPQTSLTSVLRAAAAAAAVVWFARLLRSGRRDDPVFGTPIYWSGPTIAMSVIYPERRNRPAL
jgi:O-antigen/teichoic acid export membrane protein